MYHKTWNPWVYEEGKLRRTSKNTFFRPLKYKKPIRLLVGTESDFFDINVPHEWRREAVEVISKKPDLTFLIPSTQPDATCLLPNTWIGLKINNQVDIPKIISSIEHIPFVNRWIYFESSPKTGELHSLFRCSSSIHYGSHKFQPAYPCDTCSGDGFLNKYMIQWITVVGPNNKSMNLADVRNMHYFADALSIPFYYKQALIGKKLIREPFLDGNQYKEIPKVFKSIKNS